MAEKKKGKKKRNDFISPKDKNEDKPTKKEFEVAKWMRNNVQIKKTKFLNHNVEYFTGMRAVDALLTSKFATSEEPLFTTREEISEYLHVMLTHKFFHRALKVPVDESELKGKKGKKKDKDKKNLECSETETKEKVEKDKGTDAESSVVEGNKEQTLEKVKRKKKIRLDMHNDQRFVDSLDAYVWIYDPIPFHYWIIGTLTVLGAIGICLFPLWPPSVRLVVYYLSVAAAGFLVSIIILAVIRVIVFCLIWMLSFGKHHLWVFPNLTEDVGFFASFWPLYTYEYKGDTSTSTSKKGKKKKKDKDSDAEEEDDKPKESPEGVATSGVVEVEESNDVVEDRVPDDIPEHNSDSESESSQRSSTGKDFEMVDKQELES